MFVILVSIPALSVISSSIFLGFTHGSVANGLFDAGNRFNTVSSSFIAIISRVFYPYLSRNIGGHHAYMKLHLAVSILFALVLLLMAPFVINIFFTKEFESAITVLRIMAISLIFLSISNIYGTNYLIVIGKEKELRNCTMVVSIIGFFLMIPLVYMWSYIGAALTIVISRGLLAVFVMREALSYKKKIMCIDR